MEEKEFWLVWQPGGSKSPTQRHATESEAAIEAERLAAIVPGKPFYVLCAVIRSESKIVETTRLRSTPSWAVPKAQPKF